MGEVGAEIFGDGLADIGKSCAQAEIGAGLHLLAEREQGHVFARVIGAGDGGIAAVVGGEDGEIGRASCRERV